MKHRSLPQLISINIVTLGFYELYWLAQTRNEMAVGYGLNMPRTGVLMILKGLQTVIFIGVLLAVFVGIPQGNRQVHNLTKPSPQCFIDYVDSSDRTRAGKSATVTEECRSTVDNYYDSSRNGDDYIMYSLYFLVGAFIVMPLASWLFMKWWLVPYACAVERVTGNAISATAATLLLAVGPPTAAMYAIQSAFNKVE